jgi:hypothetical protein
MDETKENENVELIYGFDDIFKLLSMARIKSSESSRKKFDEIASWMKYSPCFLCHAKEAEVLVVSGDFGEVMNNKESYMLSLCRSCDEMLGSDPVKRKAVLSHITAAYLKFEAAFKELGSEIDERLDKEQRLRIKHARTIETLRKEVDNFKAEISLPLNEKEKEVARLNGLLAEQTRETVHFKELYGKLKETVKP